MKSLFSSFSLKAIRNITMLLLGIFCTNALLAQNTIFLLSKYDVNTLPAETLNNIRLLHAFENDLLCETSDINFLTSVKNHIPTNIIETQTSVSEFGLITSKNSAKVDFTGISNILFADKNTALVFNNSVNQDEIFAKHLTYTPLKSSNNKLSLEKTIFKPNDNKEIDTLIQNFITEINTDSLYSYLMALQNMNTRFCLASNRKAVSQWIKNKFISLGISNAKLDSFRITTSFGGVMTTWQYNVVATIEGKNPNDVIIVGGHHDAIVYPGGSPLTFAPGADDNATSVATCLEIARIISKKGYIPEKTIKFVTFAAEELGLYGSYDYAAKALSQSERILMMVNNDMTGNNSGTTNWKINLQNYYGSEWVTALARQITLNYTSITPVDVNQNSAGSDSYPFFLAGYPCIFLQEYEFSPYYHSNNDLVANLNIPYFAEVIKVCAGMWLHQDASPAPIQQLTVRDMGNGTQLLAKWLKNKDNDLKHYKIGVGTASGVYTTFYTTTDTMFIIPNLTENVNYFIGVSAVDSSMYESLITEGRGKPLSVPLAPTALDASATNAIINLTWKPNDEVDILGYDIYRSENDASNYSKINSTVINSNTYSDNNASPHTLYFYKIKAIDSLLNESAYSNEVKSRLNTMDMGILVVDDSEGGVLSPTDAMVDNFYNNLLSGFTYTNYDAINQGQISITDLGLYSTVIWHSQNSQLNTILNDYINEVIKYLQAGGNLLLTLDRPSRALLWNNTYPKQFEPGQAMYDWFKVQKVEKYSSTRFIGAFPVQAAYDSIYIDTLKTPATYNHHLTNVEAITPTPQATTIYTYDTYFDPSTVEGSMKGLPVGIAYFGNDYKLIHLSFALYYMKFQQVQDFIQYVLTQKFDELLQVDKNQKINSTSNQYFTIYPNPTSNFLNIESTIPIEGNICITITDIAGRTLLQQHIENVKDKTFSHRINISSFNLSKGVYFSHLHAEKQLNQVYKILVE